MREFRDIRFACVHDPAIGHQDMDRRCNHGDVDVAAGNFQHVQRCRPTGCHFDGDALKIVADEIGNRGHGDGRAKVRRNFLHLEDPVLCGDRGGNCECGRQCRNHL